MLLAFCLVKSLSSVFIFKLCHFKAFDDYITLHNSSTLLVTIHHTMELYTRDMIIIFVGYLQDIQGSSLYNYTY